MADNNNIEERVKITYDTNAEEAAKSVNKLDKSIDKTVKTTDKSSKSSKKLTDVLEELGGGIGSTITEAKGLLKQMWLLVANPIGAVVAALVLGLTALYKAFTSTKAGGEQLEQIMDGLGAVFDVLRDKIIESANIIKKFLSGDVVGAFKDAKAAVSGFGDEVVNEFRKAAEARKMLQEVADSMRELGVARAKLNRDLVETKEVIESENATYEEKIKAIEKVQKAEEEQTKLELENAEKKLKAIRQQNALSDSSSEALQAEADAEAELYSIQQKSSEDRIKNIRLRKKADAEEESRLKEIHDRSKKRAEEKAKIKEEEQKEIQRIKDLELSEEEKALRRLQDLKDKTEEEKLARQKERDLADIERLRQQGVDVVDILKYNQELYDNLEKELEEKKKKKEEEEANKKIEKKAKELEEEFNEAETSLARKEELLIKERELLLSQTNLTQDEKNEILKNSAKKEVEIEKAKQAQKKAIQDAEFGLLNDGLGAAKKIFEKNKGIQKGILIAENAAALAKVTMNTIEAVSKDNAASPLTLGMPWSGIHIAQGAIGAANIIAATTSGLKALGGGSAGSAPTVSARGGGASATPQVSFQASTENQIATSIAQNTNEQEPVKAYVVTSEVTKGQDIDKKKIEDNSF